MKRVTLGAKTYDEVIFTEEEAIEFANCWLEIIGLRDWSVVVKIRLEKDMMKSSAQGAVQGYTDKKIALIDILDPIDYDTVLPCPQNMAKTIIHELLHVLFYPLKIKEKLERQEEVVIEHLSSALYGLTAGHFV